MRITRNTGFGACLGAAAIFIASNLTGCGNGANEVGESIVEANMPEGGNVEIDTNDGSVTIAGKDGQGGSMNLQAGESVELPADFPDDIPVPDGVNWNLVQNSTVDGRAGVTVQGTLDTPLAEVAEYMRSEVTDEGWESLQAVQQAGEMEMLTFKKGERTLHVTLSKAQDQTSIMIASQ